MPSIRFRRDKRPRGGFEGFVRAEYGPDARISSIEEVRVGGVAGFFAKRVLEVTVDVPDPHIEAVPDRRPPRPAAAAGAGISALIDEADAAERALVAPAVVPPAPTPVSTEGAAFAQLLEELQREAAPRTRTVVPGRDAPPAAPPRAGDLVVVAGLAADAARVTAAFARDPFGGMLFEGGELHSPERPRVDDRRTATAARARGVEAGHRVLVTYGLGSGASVVAHLDALRQIGADQLWLVVDASRKADDTERWVRVAREALRVHALAVVHGAHTASPATVDALGLPVGWTERV